MIYHVLPGDAHADEFRKAGLDGSVVVFREALITGPLDGDNVDEFFDARAHFLLAEYGEDEIDYQEKVADEVLRLLDANEDDEINLWFEYELFCSVNYWFCLDLVKSLGTRVYRVAPADADPERVWEGFAGYDQKRLTASYSARIELGADDMLTGSELWSAFRRRDAARLFELGEYRSAAFPFLKEVSAAAAEIDTRPSEIVAAIVAEGNTEFEDVFGEFRRRAGVYGFGDLQVEKILERL